MKTIPVFSVSMYIIDALSSSPRKISLGPTTLLERVYIPKDFKIVSLSLGLGNELGNHYQHQMVDYQRVSSAIFESSFASLGDGSKIYEVKDCRLRLFTVRNGYAISNLEKPTDIAYPDPKRLFGFYKPENEEFTIYVPKKYKFIPLELERFLSQTRLYYVLSDYGIVISRYTG